MTDVTQQVNSVQRAIGTRVIEAGEAKIVTISQAYDATIEDVWDACTSPADTALVRAHLGRPAARRALPA
jgi:hypothetical protein